jgi:hypothetical protein
VAPDETCAAEDEDLHHVTIAEPNA